MVQKDIIKFLGNIQPESFNPFPAKHNIRSIIELRFHSAMQLADWGDYSSAESLLKSCLDMEPDAVPVNFHLGEMLRRQGKASEAKKAFKRYLDLDPQDHLGAALKLTLIDNMQEPFAHTTNYVRGLFDQYAETFENCLQNNLDYAAPAAVAGCVHNVWQGPYTRMLDLGCGTGLSALPFHDKAQWIEGVDLSEGMLAQARQKDIYHALHNQEITAFLQNSAGNYDLILAVDVFVYIGDLLEIFENVGRCLSEKGLFAFSVQISEEGDYVLKEDHRYSHSKDYIENNLLKTGMSVVSCTPHVLRTEFEMPVYGLVYVLKKDCDVRG